METRLADALLVVDVQTALVSMAFNAHDVLAAIAGLQTRARERGAPVVYLRHSHSTYGPMMRGAAGWEIATAVAPKAGELVIEKTASDGFHGTELAPRLRALGIGHLVVTGFQTECCVDTTCRAAASHGFHVTLAADGHSTWDAALPAEAIIRHHNEALPRMAHPSHRVRVRSSSEIDFAPRQAHAHKT